MGLLRLRGLVFSSNIVIIFLLIITAQLLWSTNAANDVHFTQFKVKNCTYLVNIETTCTEGAGTSNRVSLRFGDANSNEVLVRHLNSKHAKRVDPLEPQVLDDLPRKPFQPCMLDQFVIEAQCVDSPICSLYLKLAGDDDWRPGFATVRVLDPQKSHLSSNYFYIRRYLPRRVWHGSDVCDPVVTPFGLKYRKKIYRNNPQIVD